MMMIWRRRRRVELTMATAFSLLSLMLMTLASRSTTTCNAYVASSSTTRTTRAPPPPPPPPPSSRTSTTTTTTPTSFRGKSGRLVRTAPDQKWQEMHGNYVLRPTMTTTTTTTKDGEKQQQQQQQRPRALLHFLGGAFVGAAPHVSYRYMLERLAHEGYLIVATPYDMSFNHLDMCQTVADRFQAVWPMLQEEYSSSMGEEGDSEIPTVGIGHSCGSLLHLLMSSSSNSNTLSSLSSEKREIPQLPHRSANVLMSFNNKPAKDSIPYFDELVAPLSQAAFSNNYYSKNPTQLNFIRLAHEARAASDVGFLLTEMERAEAQASRDVDFVLYEMKRAAQFMALRAEQRRNRFNPWYDKKKRRDELLTLPLAFPGRLPESSSSASVFSTAAKLGISAFVRPAKRTLQTMTLLNQVVDAMDQVPLLFQQVADGADDFFPAPAVVRDFARQSYQTPRTLILQYQDDTIDESEDIEKLLLEQSGSSSSSSSRSPTTERRVHRKVLLGGHSAPLIAPPLHVATSAERSFGKAKAQERLLYAHADATVTELTRWLESEEVLGDRSGHSLAAV